MNIGAAAKKSGISAKTIRYYESVGLMPKVDRGQNGYRDYGEREIEMLKFIARARGLGFSLKDVSSLIALWQDQSRASADVKKLARGHIEEISIKIQEMEEIKRVLSDLVERCHGDDRPDCPILDGLTGKGCQSE